MSDFLSNFSHDKYKETMSKKKTEKEIEKKPEENIENTSLLKEHAEELKPSELVRKKKRKRKEGPVNLNPDAFKKEENLFDSPQLVESEDAQFAEEPIVELVKEAKKEEASDELHDVEIDPEYQKKQRNKKITMGVSILLVLLAGYFTYYKMSHVKMPNFKEKSITDARKWANENRMELELKPAFSLKIPTNDIIKQANSAGKNVKKGSTLNFTVSEGPDPEEKIKLPDFKKMSQGEAEQFIEKNKADSLSIISEYSDKVEKGKFIRIEFNDKETVADTYRRRDMGNLYYSKGKEVFEKNISVPSFSGKTKADVEEWANKNSISVKYNEVDSNKVEEGKIVSQSLPKDKKIAKKDKMTVDVSAGKAIVVPNFGDYSAESANTAAEGLEVSIQQVFSDTSGFGQLISQSVPAGTKLTGKDSKSIKVVYSVGQPYIKSYYGQLEGDIPKFLYEDFNSKGANITYEIYYVNSDQEKGTIVQMSTYNQYIPSNAYITFGISNGSDAGKPGKVDRKNAEEKPE